MTTNVVPLWDYVLIEREKVEEKKTAGGILIPKKNQKEPVFCKILKIGAGARDELPSVIKVGTRVLVDSYAGTAVEIDDEPLLMVKCEDIKGYIDE